VALKEQRKSSKPFAKSLALNQRYAKMKLCKNFGSANKVSAKRRSIVSGKSGTSGTGGLNLEGIQTIDFGAGYWCRDKPSATITKAVNEGSRMTRVSLNRTSFAPKVLSTPSHWSVAYNS